MATDSTELTFVRCPSCRSLVPAVSTRCRMCGATLDASQAAPEESEVKRSGRVRQRTMTQPEADFMNTTEKVRESVAEGSPQPNGSGDQSSTMNAEAVEGESSEDSDFHASDPLATESEHEIEPDLDADPLSAYIEEVAIEEPQEAKKGDETPQHSAKGSDTDTFPWEMLDQDESDMGGAEDSDHDSDFDNPQAVPEQKKGVQSGTAEVNGADSARQAAPEPAAKESSSRESNAAKDQPAPRVIVESGSRRGNKPSGLSFGKPRQDSGGSSERGGRGDKKRHDHKHANSHSASSHSGFEGGSEGRHSHSGHEQRRKDTTDTESDRNKGRSGEQHGQRHQQGGADRNRTDTRSPGQHRVQHSAGPGRLVGWFISYSNPSGVAVEIREGKYFVTQTSLKDRDMIIDHDSISTPHALVVVSAEDGVRVQDLMSDRGVFLRRRKSDSFQRLTETTTIEHGEWLRFGDVEYLVSLVPPVEGR